MTYHPTRDPLTRQIDPNAQPSQGSLEEPLPSADDPGGAHIKGYSADPKPEKDVKEEGPIPLAATSDAATAVKQPEREGKVRPTGRSEPAGYSPNDRLMGSDR